MDTIHVAYPRVWAFSLLSLTLDSALIAMAPAYVDRLIALEANRATLDELDTVLMEQNAVIEEQATIIEE